MRSGSYFSLLKIVIHGRSSMNILMATLFSFTFSITVILSTFGLMDGFDYLLKSGLKHSSGDVLITSKKGFFEVDDNLKNIFDSVSPKAIAPVIQSEAFALFQGISKGVLVRGVEDKSFNLATGMSVSIGAGEIAIGQELASQFGLKVGDELALTFGRGHESSSSLPSIKKFKVAQVVGHGIYLKDLRFVYLPLSELQQMLNVGSKLNLIILAVQEVAGQDHLVTVKHVQRDLRSQIQIDKHVKPFWNEYSFLIEAVKVEKFSITLILQLIVIVAVFNIMAFVIYIMEKKAQDFFFLRAIGLDLKSLLRFWWISVILIWFFSCIGAHLLSHLFNWCLTYLSFLQIPGEIYVLSSLRLKLDLKAYLTVYLMALIWVLIVAFFSYLRLRRRTIIEGLRQEFSA